MSRRWAFGVSLGGWIAAAGWAVDLGPQVHSTNGVVLAGRHSIVRGEWVETGKWLQTSPEAQVQLRYREGVSLDLEKSSRYRIGERSQSWEGVTGELSVGSLRVGVADRYGPRKKLESTAYGPKTVYVLRTPLGVVGLGDMGRGEEGGQGGQMRIHVKRLPNGRSEIHLSVQNGSAWIARSTSEFGTPASTRVDAGHERSWEKFPPLGAGP